MKTQTPASGSQAAPVNKDKGQAKEACKTVTKEGEQAKGKKGETLMSKKDNGKKPVASALETKKEENQDVTK